MIPDTHAMGPGFDPLPRQCWFGYCVLLIKAGFPRGWESWEKLGESGGAIPNWEKLGELRFGENGWEKLGKLARAVQNII